ncbi:MAG: hypothetical protein WCI41_03610 [bacterium]
MVKVFNSLEDLKDMKSDTSSESLNAPTEKKFQKRKRTPKNPNNNTQINKNPKTREAKNHNKPRKITLKKTFEATLHEREEKRTNATKGAVHKFVESALTHSEQKTIEQIADLFKENKIKRIAIHGKEDIDQEKESGKLTIDGKELDSQSALAIINNYTKENLYVENGAMTSIIPKGGTKENLIKQDEDQEKKLDDRKIGMMENKTDKGMNIILDVGGEWLKIVGSNGSRIIYIDHHGEGQHAPTSGTELIYKILKEADLLKEGTEWLENYTKEVTKFDNLTYLEDKDAKGNKIYNEKYVEDKNGWVRTPYALGDDFPAELMKWYETGKIKDFSTPLTDEQLKELGGEELITNTTKKAEFATYQIERVKWSDKHNKKEGLNLTNTDVGNIVYHNFPNTGRVITKGGKHKGEKVEEKNLIDNKFSFIATKTVGSDTYVCWNKEKGKFYINSKHPNIEEIAEKLNEADPGCIKDIRGEMFRGKIINLTEKQFLDIIDPKITKGSKIEKTDRLEKIEKRLAEIKKEREEIKEIRGELQNRYDFYEYLKNTNVPELNSALMSGDEAKIKEVQEKLYLEYKQKNPIKKEDFNKFVDNNEVSEKILQNIAGKIINNEQLTTEEVAIYQNKSSEVENIIQNIKNSQEKEESAQEAPAETEAEKIDNMKESISNIYEKEEVKKQNNIEIGAKIYSIEEIKKILPNILYEKIKILKKIDKLNLDGINGEIKLDAEVTIKYMITISGIKIKGSLENIAEKIKIKDDYIIEAGSLTKKAKKEIQPYLEKVNEYIKEYIEKEEGKKVEKINIKDGKLEVVFKQS